MNCCIMSRMGLVIEVINQTRILCGKMARDYVAKHAVQIFKLKVGENFNRII